MADELMRSHGVWSGQMGESRLNSAFVPQLGNRLLSLLLFPCIPAAVTVGILAVVGSSALLAAVISCVLLTIVCGSISSYLGFVWTTSQSYIDGASLKYTSSMKDSILLFMLVWFLNVVTLGLFWALGLGSSVLNKFRWSHVTREGVSSEPGRSGFVGNYLFIIATKLVTIGTPIVILYMTGLIKQRGKPAIGLWNFLCSVVDNGTIAFRDNANYNIVTTLIWSGIMLFVACLFLLPLHRYKMMKWEISNAVVDGYRLKFEAKFNDYLLLVFLNGFLTVITFGLYAAVGFNRISMTKFRVMHTRVFVPASALISQDVYTIPKESLNPSFRDSVREIFNPASRRKALNYTRRYWTLYLLLVIPIVYFIIFKYIPMLYIQIGAKQNNIILPIWDVPWAKNYGFEWFINAFKNRDFINALRNTLMLNGLDLLFGFPAPIILALLLNELTFKRFKRVSQTIFYMPHFLSWVIISSIALQLFNPTNGLVNLFLERMNLTIVDPFKITTQWVVMYVVLGIWQSAGWGTIIYLAAITNINPELYEAASVDGAGRLRKMWHVTLPGLRPTIIVLLIMRMGSILGSDFERPFALRNDLINKVSDGISIFVYIYGLKGTKFSLTSAVGIFSSVICLIFLFAANSLAKKFGERGIW